MDIRFRIFFDRVEPWFGTITVPDDWHEWDSEYQTEWLTDRMQRYRSIWVEEWDEVTVG